MSDTTPSVAIFAHRAIGKQALAHVLEHHPEHIRCVVVVKRNEIYEMAKDAGCVTHIYRDINTQDAASLLGPLDYIFLAWWPKIIKANIIRAPSKGVINFHPSLLPHNRGKHYNFWTIVEGSPFGVTLHFVDEGIDSGDIVFQSTIEKSWLDNGGTLYRRAGEAMIQLFKDRYLDIVYDRYTRIPQDPNAGSFHYGKELGPASQIDLDATFTARDLLNRLRARTFEGMPSCYFYDHGKKYEVRLSIQEVEDE